MLIDIMLIGTSMVRLYKEITKLREEIERNESTTIKSYGREGANIERFIKLISHGWNCGNAVKFAIRKKSYGCVEEILKILTGVVKEQPPTWPGEQRQIWYILQSLSGHIARLARTAIRNRQHIFAKILLESLEDEQRYDVIKQKEGCESKCSGDTHGEGCKAGYNLLMLALETLPDDGLLPSYIVDFVCKHQDLEYKTEIAMGKREPEIYGRTSNGIRLAATKAKREIAKTLLWECLRPEHCYRAFLEVGPPKNPHVSAMASVLEEDDITSLLMLRFERHRKALRKTLESPRMQNNFWQLKMTQGAIRHFCKVKLLQNNYLIPQPSELSRPMALIFYNTFCGVKDPIPRTKWEAECLGDALQSLGWGQNTIDTIPNWTFNQLIKKLKCSIKQKRNHCSLFLLYITSHGFANNVCGMPESGEEFSSGPISDIIKTVTTLLPTFIPKVLIFDTCRTGKEIASHTITYHNIILINATVLGRVAYSNQFIPHLVEQIIEWADSRVPFIEMLRAASGNVKVQIPHFEATHNKKLVLRRYDGNENSCMYCKKDIKNCYRECLICPNCFRWYHPSCAGQSQANYEKSKESTYAPLLCLKCAKREVDETL